MDAQNKNPIPTQEEIEAVYNRVKKHEEEIAAFAGYIANVKKAAGSHLAEIEDGKAKLFQVQEASAAALEAKSQELIKGLTQTVSNANLEVQNKVTDFQIAKDSAQKAINVFREVEDNAKTQSQQLNQEQSGLEERIKSVNELNESLKSTLTAVQLIETQIQQTKKLTEENAQTISNLKENCEQLRTETNNRAEEATARKIQLEDEFKGLQEAIAVAQGTLIALSEGIKNEKANVATVTAQFQQQFSEAQEKRLNEFNDSMKALKGDIDTFRALASSDLEAQKKKLDKDIEDKIVLLDSKVDETLKLMEEKNHKASKLLEAVGVKTHTYNYAAVSEKEEKTADKLRSNALTFMIIAVVVLVAPSIIETFVNSSAEWKDIWQNMLMRLPISFVLLFPAFYLMAEASKHRKVQFENKRIELELAALTPYMELFDDARKQAVKEQLVKNYFVGHGQDETEHEKEEVNSWVQKLVPEIIGKVLDHVPGIKKG